MVWKEFKVIKFTFFFPSKNTMARTDASSSLSECADIVTARSYRLQQIVIDDAHYWHLKAALDGHLVDIKDGQQAENAENAENVSKGTCMDSPVCRETSMTVMQTLL